MISAMSKRLGALLMILVMILSMFPASAFAEESGETEEAPAHEHAWSAWTVTAPATCASAGEQRRSCECGAVETAAVPALPHTWGEWEVLREPTCSAEGERKHACTVCGAEETEAIPVVLHTWGEWAVEKEATCSAEGEKVHTCTVCGAEETEAVPVIPHTWGEWTVKKEATCSAEGEKVHTCTVCGAEETGSVPVIPHTWGEWEVLREPTCSKEGKQKHVCTVCSAEETEHIATIPHTWGEWEVLREPTCAKEGKQKHVCTVCGAEETEAIPVLPHTWGEWELKRESTCAKEGKQERVCEVCGEVEKQYLPLAEHTWGEWELKRESTCTKEGKQERVCEVCGEVEKEYFPLKEHSWDEDGVCTVCGEKKPLYTVVWLDEDGTELEKDVKVEPGTAPSYDGSTPAKAEDDDNTYEFTGWSPDPAPVTDNVAYTAQYRTIEKRSDEIIKSAVFENLTVTVSAPAGAFPKGTEVILAAAGGADVSCIDEAAELVGAVSVSFEKKGKAQTASDGVTVTVAMAGAQKEGDIYKAFSIEGGSVNARDDGQPFSTACGGVFGVAHIPVPDYTVTFDPANGEAPAEYTLKGGAVIGDVLPENPEKDGFRFIGWFSEDGSEVTAATVVRSNLTVTAEYVQQLSVTFDPANGEDSICIVIDKDSAIGSDKMPADPEKTDCDFVKWVDSSDESIEITADTVPGDNIAASAVYKPKMPAVSFSRSAGGVSVSVSAPEGAFPIHTTMIVFPIAASGSLDTFSGAVNETIVDARIVDISFWLEGKEIQPEKPVVVTLGVGAFVNEEGLSVVHVSDDGAVSVLASGVAGSGASFEAEHFSKYGVIVPAPKPLGEDGPFATSTSELVDDEGNAKGFYISAQSGNSAKNVYYFMAETVDGGKKIKKTAANDIGSASLYYFEKQSDGTYKIYTEVSNVKQYLNMSVTSGKDANLMLSDEGTLFSVKIDDTTGNATILGNHKYLNLSQRDLGVGFAGYYDTEYPDGINPTDGPIRLVSESAIDLTDLDPYNLDGKNYAIMYYTSGNSGKVMTITADGNKLKEQAVTVNETGVEIEDGITAKSITWIFEAVGGGHYRLKTSDGKYFSFSSTGNDADISLVGSEEATVLSVSPGSTGGNTGSHDGPATQGNYRFTWTVGDNKYSIAIKIDNGFIGRAENKEGQTKSEQWFDLVKPLRTVTYKYTGTVPAGAPSVPEEATYDSNETVTVADAPTLAGYTFSGWSKTGKFNMPDEDVTITGSWSPRTDLSYTVHYYLKDTTKKVADDKVVEGKTLGEEVKEEAKKISGFKVVDKTPKTITIKAEGNEIIFYYEPDTFDGKIIVYISGAHWTHIYDGKMHSDIGYLAASNNAEYNKGLNDGHGNDPNIAYTGNVEVFRKDVGVDSVDLRQVTFKNRNPHFTNVKFVILNDCYTTYEITKRSVTLTSASDEKEYDGEALTNENVTETGDGFVAGEGATYSFTGSQTEEGSSDNIFTYALKANTREGNYKITVNYGTLKVTAGPKEKAVPPVDDEPEEPDDSGNVPSEPAEEPDNGSAEGTPAWALMNLIATILTVCTGAGMVGTYFKKKDEDERKKSKFLGLIPGVGSVATFFMTEDLSAKMVLTDKWTILMVAILAIGGALGFLTRNGKDKE